MKNQVMDYINHGMSVIPIQANTKRPSEPWEKHQHTKRTIRDLEPWEKNINLNTAIVTGAISGYDIIDIETCGVMDHMLDQFPELRDYPIVRTPGGGYHIYVAHCPDFSRKIKILPDVDYLGTGGYALLPESVVNGKQYIWINKLCDTPKPMPDALRKKLLSQITPTPIDTNDRGVAFNQGTRDESIFHTALTLFKQRWSRNDVLAVCARLAAACNPPFSYDAMVVKVDSAQKRCQEPVDASFKDEVTAWIQEADRIFTLRDIREELIDYADTQKKAKYANLKKIIQRSKEDGDIVPHGAKRGTYRKVEADIGEINLLKPPGATVDIHLPFGLHQYIKIYPGNIILVAGEKNSGKTAILLNMAIDNMDKWDTHYFNSEMGEEELVDRLSLFGRDMQDISNQMRVYERSDRFADVIKTGPGKLNIIDFMEIHEEHYLIGKWINDIHKKLKGALAVIAVQKKPGQDIGVGGIATIEKPRVVLACKHGEVKIVVAKNFKGHINPRGTVIKYKLVDGCKIYVTHDELLNLHDDMKYGRQ